MKKSIRKSSMWDSKQIKLSILVPTRDTVHSQFSYCLAQLYKTTSELGIETFLFYDSSTILLNQRERLLEQAKKVNSDYVLWIDSDMMFPSTTAVRLLEHNKDIVACNYTKWEMVDRVGNVFNRLIMYRADNYHVSLDYFGKDMYDGRLFQVFFFNTER